MQNLKKDNFVQVIHVNGKIERKQVAKLNIDYNDYTEENIYKITKYYTKVLQVMIVKKINFSKK